MPTAWDTPTAAAARSLVIPVATTRQNSLSTSLRCAGDPGDFIGARPVSSLIHPAGLPIDTSIIKLLRRPLEFALRAVVGVDDAARCRTAILDGHVEGVHNQVRILHAVDGPSDDASRVRVEHATAVNLSFTRGVLRNVRAPQLVGPVPMEPAVHEIVGRHYATQSFDPGGTGKAVSAGVVHQHRHESLADEDAESLREFGVHAP